MFRSVRKAKEKDVSLNFRLRFQGRFTQETKAEEGSEDSSEFQIRREKPAALNESAFKIAGRLRDLEGEVASKNGSHQLRVQMQIYL
ncbi:hypothetical protein DLM76_08495 [Leptospira yasudae]|nr:hypothetical protein DLM76_08495 [Leptospira yasudae]